MVSARYSQGVRCGKSRCSSVTEAVRPTIAANVSHTSDFQPIFCSDAFSILDSKPLTLAAFEGPTALVEFITLHFYEAGSLN
jgi:hypothetical protein